MRQLYIVHENFRKESETGEVRWSCGDATQVTIAKKVLLTILLQRTRRKDCSEYDGEGLHEVAYIADFTYEFQIDYGCEKSRRYAY